ncbi:hypothetical protein KCU81_g2950, partial [Aureobasidium melanogenum]|uniref:Uncharacterized protein n=1 Tax=Aureobasidium melanogenum (strain CBS 110374) TaxID=1043003 RepID=A0A074VI92_AURM1
MDSSSTIMKSEYADMMDETSDTLSHVGDGEISVIDYARYHGLSKDYTSVYPLSHDVLHSIPQWEDPDLELAQRPEFELPTELDLDEKWTIDHQSALFLRQITSVEEVPSTGITRRKSRSTEYKVEPLLLPTDPELEQRRFMRARHSRQRKDTPEIPPEAFWQDDEGAALHWPDSKLPETLMEQIKQEKLQLGKNDILFLQQCISFPDELEMQDLDVPPYKKASFEYEEARHTSPLLPCSSPFQFSVPDSPVSRIPLATSPIDPVPAEIKRIEDSMDVDDEFSLDGLSDISALGIEAPDEYYSRSPLKRRRPDDYKVEVPLSPVLESSPMKKLKMVTFSDELCISIPEYARPFPLEDSNGTDDVQDFLEQVIEPGAKSALLAIDGEQLSQADSILRVEVPVIDESGPLPPWKAFARKQLGCQTELEAQQQLISMLKRETIRPCEHWPHVGRIDGTMSCWRPFDLHLDDLPEEEIECDYLSDFNPEKPEDTTSGWKLEGLRTLDPCEDDDEEIKALDMSVALKNLNLMGSAMDINAPSKSEGRKSAAPLQTRLPFFSPTKTYETHEDSAKPHENPKATQSLAPSTFSVSNSLDRFMQTYTGKKTCVEKPDLQTEAVLKNVEKPTHSPHTHVERHDDLKEATSCLPIHRPSLPTPVPPRTFVLSSTMFERRKLVKEIERLNAMSEYIERDFTSPRMLRGLSSQTSEADEADVIIAPGHGIMLTTLQKVMQKSLPGEVVRNVIRERIVQLARRYERLIIMVHEDQSSDQQRPLDNRESGELVSLINFCAAQSHDIQVMYIPGDELALATWIVASMIRYGLDDSEVHLIQDETTWELFLRKAGMDAFAAQAILNKLKAPIPMPTPSTKQFYGLPAFVMMDETERLRLFGALFGGEKILRKVSMAIDGCLKRNVVAGDLKR